MVITVWDGYDIFAGGYDKMEDSYDIFAGGYDKMEDSYDILVRGNDKMGDGYDNMARSYDKLSCCYTVWFLRLAVGQLKVGLTEYIGGSTFFKRVNHME